LDISKIHVPTKRILKGKREKTKIHRDGNSLIHRKMRKRKMNKAKEEKGFLHREVIQVTLSRY